MHARRSTEPPRHRSTPAPHDDRRGHARQILKLVITMHGETNFYTGHSEDLSAGGIFIATTHVLPIGTPVVLSFTLPGSDVPIGVVGTVQWVRGPNGTVKPGMGVRFDDLCKQSLHAIRAFTLQRTPELLD